MPGFWDSLNDILNKPAIRLGSQAGLGLLTSYLNNRGTGQQNQRLDARTAMLDKMAADEQKRREYYTSILMPSLMRGIGQRDPNVLAQTRSRMPGQPNQVQPPWQNYQAPQQSPATPTSTGRDISATYGQPNSDSLEFDPRRMLDGPGWWQT